MRNVYVIAETSRNQRNQLTSLVMIAESVSLGVLSLPATMTALGLVPYVGVSLPHELD